MSKRSMASGHNHVIIYEYTCDKCGLKMFVPRKKCDARKSGHKKDMFCIKCKKTSKFTQGNIR